VQAGRDDHPLARASLDVDVWVDAALADEAQARQARQQRCAHLRPLADQHERLRIFQPAGEEIHVIDVVVEHRHLERRQLPKTAQRAERVEVIVEDGDLHAP